MKSYIQHLQAPDVPTGTPLSSKSQHDESSPRSKRRVLVRSMSDPLLQVPGLDEEPIRRRGGRRRPAPTCRQVERGNSFDGELMFEGDSSCTNATRPMRRGSIENNETSSSSSPTSNTTLVSAIREQFNAKRPTRRGSMKKAKANSCPDLSEHSEHSRDSLLDSNHSRTSLFDDTSPLPTTTTTRPTTSLRMSQQNLTFRAEILCNALDDMGLFDEEEDAAMFLSLERARILSPF